jgi:3-methyladenine DNA glycosylase AlkD
VWFCGADESICVKKTILHEQSQFSRDLIQFVSQEFRLLANPAKALGMAAYLKTDMPFYGIQKPERMIVYRSMKNNFSPGNRRDYESGILALWNLPHREEKYAAIQFARQADIFVNADSIALYEKMIRQGAWWDLVDEVGIKLVGRVLLGQRAIIKPTIYKWIKDHDLWIRRAALISHIGHKHETDENQLFLHCQTLAHEKEFFIGKAIGWALRDYSWHNPEAVLAFLRKNSKSLSNLSRREAAKRLNKFGMSAEAF